MNKFSRVGTYWVGWLLVVGTLLWYLHKAGIHWFLLLAWLYLSAAIIAMMEVSLWRHLELQELHQRSSDRPIQPSETEPFESELRRINLEDEQFTKHTSRRLIVLALLLGSAFGLLLTLHAKAPAPPVPNSMSMQFPPQMEAALEAYLKHPPSSPESPGAKELTARLDPDLQKEVLSYLRRPSPQPGGPSWSAVVLIVLVAAAGAVFLGLALQKHPTATPLAVIATLAATMITKGPHPSIQSATLLWVLVITLLASGIGLLSFGVWCLRDSGPDGEPLLSYGLSLVVLGSTVFCLAHHAEAPQVISNIVARPPPLPPSLDLRASPMTSVTGFKPGHAESSDSNAIQLLAGNLANHNAKESDILLLLGSADCTPSRGLNNDKLARTRANWVHDSLAGTQRVIPRIVVSDLPQHSSCKGTDALRAVNAFLIQPKQAESQSKP